MIFVVRYSDIPQFISGGHYAVDVGMSYLEAWIKTHNENGQRVNIDPDFQRCHVWTMGQQIKFVEYLLKGGVSSRTLYWNHPTWMSVKVRQKIDLPEELTLVDGKQRLQAVRLFLSNAIPAFGHYRGEFEDTLSFLVGSLRMQVNNLNTRKELLQWYLDLNDGGVAHTPKEIAKVRKLLEAEEGK